MGKKIFSGDGGGGGGKVIKILGMFKIAVGERGYT